MDQAAPIGNQIRQVLLDNLPAMWDGKACIEELKRHDSQWRQLEWIGFYFEFAASRVLIERLGGQRGPKFGNVEFDYEKSGVWDFKASPSNSGSKWAYLNGKSEVDQCLRARNHLGWVIAVGEATYDDDGEFKAWHDALKGKKSRYVEERIRRGAPSRRRKVRFNLTDIAIVEFRSVEGLQAAVDAGWMNATMQQGQRNADGSPRNPKYAIRLDLVPPDRFVR